MSVTPLQFIRGRRVKDAAFAREPKPDWLKVRAPGSPSYLRLRALIRELSLNTVCEEAHCPNIGECWHHGTATFMIMGDVCTRACGYCNVTHGTPLTLDPLEPERLAHAVDRLELARLGGQEDGGGTAVLRLGDERRRFDFLAERGA